MEENRPLEVLAERIASAVAGPTPGRSSSCCCVAVFRSRGPEVGAAPPVPDGACAGAGADSPWRGRYTRSPSETGAARLTRSMSIESSTPPATSMRSATRDPAGRRCNPGCRTAPAAWTKISAIVVVLAGAGVNTGGGGGSELLGGSAPIDTTASVTDAPSSSTTAAAAAIRLESVNR